MDGVFSVQCSVFSKDKNLSYKPIRLRCNRTTVGRLLRNRKGAFDVFH
jgi:hypothetical protein